MFRRNINAGPLVVAAFGPHNSRSASLAAESNFRSCLEVIGSDLSRLILSFMVEIETQRLRLRLWRVGDWRGLQRAYGDAEVTRWIGGNGPSSTEFTAYAVGRMTMHWDALGYGQWAVVEKSSGRLLGRVGLMHHNDWTVDEHNIEIGWTLQRSCWGQGYATEGALAARDWAFRNLAIERLISITLPDNERSQAVMRRIGMSPQGEAFWREQNHVYYALDRRDWESLSAR